jgi:hypothetical protein
VFAWHRNHGLKPYWPQTILQLHIQPLAGKLGITKTIGWRTFRRTYASLLKANGEDVKVVQELHRHANPNTTLRLYAQAFTADARRAQGKIVEMVRNTPRTISRGLRVRGCLMCVNVQERKVRNRCNLLKQMVGAIGFEPMTSTV